MNKTLFGFLTVVMLAISSFFTSAFTPANNVRTSTTPVTAPICVNKTVQLLNDADGANSVGNGTNHWAIDTITRTVTICTTDTVNHWHLIFADIGPWASLPGVSPNGTGNIGAGVNGTLMGGGTLEVVGTLDPLAPENSILDLGCDENGINCTYPSGTTAVLDIFFESGFSGGYNNDWGWYYLACGSGSQWSDVSDGGDGEVFTGDITDETAAPCVTEVVIVTKPDAPCPGIFKDLHNLMNTEEAQRHLDHQPFCKHQWFPGYAHFWAQPENKKHIHD